jgi:tellurite methyltransferase
MADSGGYEEGYAACCCFWGRDPGSLVTRLLGKLPDVTAFHVLDAGCGEGKNAHAFAKRGAKVTAVDCSALALHNALIAWPGQAIEWVQADVRSLAWTSGEFDVVIVYGLLHCFQNYSEIETVVSRLQDSTRVGGRHVLCSFNARWQDLSAHKGFMPCLISHEAYLKLYSSWTIEEASDDDLHETHPHNCIQHVHSLTRLIARKPA